jgi:hypothetical protein
MAISHILGQTAANVSHFLGTAKANVSAILGATASFGGGGGTVSFGSQGTIVASASSPVSVAYPASISAALLLVLFIGMKPTSSGGGSVTTPTDFTSAGSVIGSSQGAVSADAGDTNLWVFYKEATGSESGSLSVTTSGQDVCVAVMQRFTKSAGTWNVAVATGEQSTTGNISITYGSDPGVAANDYVAAYKVSPTDAGGSTGYSSETITQTGVTFDTIGRTTNAAVASGLGSSLGNDMGGTICRAAVTAGTSSTAPTFAATAGSANQGIGPSIFVRIRAA